MALEDKIAIAADFIEKVKGFVAEKLNPNMTLEKIKEIVSPRLDEIILKYDRRGIKYKNGRFSVKCVDEKHFQFEFEMYFQDDAGKWHECTNESELRDAELLEKNTWSMLKALKVITFPIEPPAIEQEIPDKNLGNEKFEGWREAEDKLNEFLPKLKTELKYNGIVDYAAKLFSNVDDSNLYLVYRIYYKADGGWVGKSKIFEFKKSEAPAWAAEGLTEKETDVTARYEKNLRLKI